MAESCLEIEELLSAYLDGRLSSEEKARVSAHLESCPACAALLDKMRRLDEMASSTMDAIDDSILEKLEQRIQADIDRLPTLNIEAKPKTGRVIPVWYRYVAVAASLVLIFMIGRAFYKSGSLDQWLPFGQDKAVEMARPPMQSAQPPAEVETKPPPETSSRPAGKPAANESKVVPPAPVRATQKDDLKETSPTVVQTTPPPPSTVREETTQETVRPTDDIHIADDAARGPVAGQRKGIDINVPPPVPVKKELSSETVESGRVVVDTRPAQESIRPVTVDDQAEPVSRKKDAQSTAAMDAEANANQATDAAADAVTVIEQKAVQLKQKAITDLGKLGYNNLVAGAPIRTKAQSGTLQSRYLAALTAYKPIGGAAGGFDGKPKGIDSTAAARYVLGQADRMPESTGLENQSAKLYLTLRAANDLYRFTGETAYRDRAVAAREALLRFLDSFSGDSTQATTANTYRTELQGITIH
ncbi:MAG: hypothetical protein GYA46_01040 [candidate division Zixibacteria bacterium]|nr:hypothetical protein [candidate division Zixibacteria bacterium]